MTYIQLNHLLKLHFGCDPSFYIENAHVVGWLVNNWREASYEDYKAVCKHNGTNIYSLPK